MKENLCRPGGVISTHFGWPPASRQDIRKKRSGLGETGSRTTASDRCLRERAALFAGLATYNNHCVTNVHGRL